MADSQTGASGNGTVTILAFLAGAAVGAGLALLLAPRPGAETRRALRASLGDAEASLKASFDRGLSMLEEARGRLAEAVEAGKEAARREAARLSREWAGQGFAAKPAASRVPGPGGQAPGSDVAGHGQDQSGGAAAAVRSAEATATGPVVR